MSVDSELVKLAQEIEFGQAWPRPVCPSCPTGHVQFSSPVVFESLKSASERDHPYFDAEWIHGTFTVEGKCTNPECVQDVHGTGDYRVDHSQDFDFTEAGEFIGAPYTDFYSITHIHPPLLIMPIPKSSPPIVREAIVRASRVLFADPGLAATALRATVERFLTSESISAANQNGKFRTAHGRIDEWKLANPDRSSVADLFVAVKWIGNAGTHEDSKLTAAEVLEGARMLDEAFHRLFDGPEIDNYARTVNDAKGPPPES